MTSTCKSYLKQLDKLYHLNMAKQMKLGLENPYNLHQALGCPSNDYHIVHVAGTNGKGSVCYKVASSLQLAGYSVGLFTSPHVSTYRERIRVNDVMISEEEVEEGLAHIFSLNLPSSFFEVTTMLALNHFKKKNVDWVVLETGLGGRLDATNIVYPDVSVITTIGYDHCQYLGDSLEEITKEKAGIIKSGVPVVVGPNVPIEYLGTVDAIHPVTHDGTNYDRENQAIAREVLKVIGVPEGRGLEKIPPCRFEKIYHSGREYILDVAHNPQALECLFSRLAGKNPTVICGMSVGKDLKKSLETIVKHTNNLHITSGSNRRCASVEEMLKAMPPHPVNTHESVTQAIEKIQESSSPIVICGSFFIMQEARKALGIVEPTDEKELNEFLGVSKSENVT